MREQAVSIVGLGLMGSALAAALQAAGYEVWGYDLSEERRREHVARGGQQLESASEAGSRADVVLTSLPTSGHVRDACLGQQGILTGMAPGALLVDTTTARPEDSVRLAGDLAAQGVGFVDASISGSSSMVATGDIVVMCGGSDGEVARALPLLNAVARSVHHIGPVGSGARAKLVVNLVLGANRLAIAEGLGLATGMGIDPTILLELLRDSAAYSKAMDIWGARMLDPDFDEPSSRVRQHHKDVGLMLEQGKQLGVALPLTTALDRVLVSAEESGFSDSDISSLYQVLRLPSREGQR